MLGFQPIFKNIFGHLDNFDMHRSITQKLMQRTILRKLKQWLEKSGYFSIFTHEKPIIYTKERRIAVSFFFLAQMKLL